MICFKEKKKSGLVHSGNHTITVIKLQQRCNKFVFNVQIHQHFHYLAIKMHKRKKENQFKFHDKNLTRNLICTRLDSINADVNFFLLLNSNSSPPGGSLIQFIYSRQSDSNVEQHLRKKISHFFCSLLCLNKETKPGENLLNIFK